MRRGRAARRRSCGSRRGAGGRRGRSGGRKAGRIVLGERQQKQASGWGSGVSDVAGSRECASGARGVGLHRGRVGMREKRGCRRAPSLMTRSDVPGGENGVGFAFVASARYFFALSYSSLRGAELSRPRARNTCIARRPANLKMEVTAMPWQAAHRAAHRNEGAIAEIMRELCEHCSG